MDDGRLETKDGTWAREEGNQRWQMKERTWDVRDVGR